jgi:hypothetical protein
MKTILSLLVLTLLTVPPPTKTLKIILKDGQFSKVPKNARMIGLEIINESNNRYGYLVFETSTDDMDNWIKESNLILTSTKETFDNNLIVWPGKRPTWFKDSSDKFKTSDIYYSKRKSDSFLSLSWVDDSRRIIHVEYEIGL